VIRLLWSAALAALAVVAVAAQLDRASLQRPELSVIVPRPFRSFAQSPAALIALATADGASAQTEARRLVRRRPMPAEHLFILAMAEMRRGQSAKFAADFRAASTRGWRFGPLQASAAQAALTSGDLPAAANRIAALWAADADNPSVRPLTTALLRAPGGAEAFAVPLAQTRVWSSNFLAASASLAPAPTIVRTVGAAQGAGAQFDCDALTRLEDQLAAANPGSDRVVFSCRPQTA
jgi:hypothetical protein